MPVARLERIVAIVTNRPKGTPGFEPMVINEGVSSWNRGAVGCGLVLTLASGKRNIHVLCRCELPVEANALAPRVKW